jgi:hypothetical protein
VNQHFHLSIISSPTLQRTMFLTPSAAGTIVPVRTTRLVRGFPRHDTVWARTPHRGGPADGSRPRLPGLPGSGSSGSSSAIWSSELNDMVWPKLNPEINYYVVNRKLDTQLLRAPSPSSSSTLALRLVPRSCSLPSGGGRGGSLSPCDSRRRMLVTQPPVADVVVGRSDTRWGMFEVHNARGVTVGDVLEVEERFVYSRVSAISAVR